VTESVWRVRVDIGPGVFGGLRTGIKPFCKRCRSDFLDVCQSGPCGGCGRMVHHTEHRWQRRSIFCSDACQRRHQSNYQATIARQRRAEARGATKVCACCREYFEPLRADALFCSGACRQKAHRHRVTATK
jgi:hypothetical protein